MATKTKDAVSTEKVKVDASGSAQDVRAVKVPDADSSEEELKAQDRALLHYKLTGHFVTPDGEVYVDPNKDQEADIAPELGVSPHPELANPAPQGLPFGGQPLDESKNPVLLSVEDKQERAEEVQKEFDEAKEAALKDAEERGEFDAAAESDAPGTPESASDARDSAEASMENVRPSEAPLVSSGDPTARK